MLRYGLSVVVLLLAGVAPAGATPLDEAMSAPCRLSDAEIAAQDRRLWLKFVGPGREQAPQPRTQALLRRLLAVHPQLPQRLALRAWRSAQINAKASSEPAIMVSTAAEALPEAELAALLAHELAHVALAHGRVQACFKHAVVASPLGFADSSREFDAALYDGAELRQRFSALSQRHELEADITASRMLAEAGLAADGLGRLLLRLAGQGAGLAAGAMTPVMSHPDHRTRIDAIDATVARVRTVTR